MSQLPRSMRVQFSTQRLLGSMALMAMTFGMLAYVIRAVHSPHSSPIVTVLCVVSIPGTLGGAIGALLGDAAEGACKAYLSLIIVALLISLASFVVAIIAAIMLGHY